MKEHTKIVSMFDSSVWEFFFNMVYISPTPDWFFVVVWIAEKLMLLSPFLMTIFYNTDWQWIHDVSSYLNVIIDRNH